MTGYNDTDAWGRDPLDADYGKLPPNEAVKPVASSTPSPSAQELAAFQDMLGDAVGLTKDWNKKCQQSAILLRRLSDTERERDGWHLECIEVEQTLGKALGYPWYKDDQKNFPSATEKDGVCVGEHVPGSIASEAAKRLLAAEAERDRLREMLAQYEEAFYQIVYTQGDARKSGEVAGQAALRHRHRLSKKCESQA